MTKQQIDNYAQDFTNRLLEENKRVNAVLDLVKQENSDLKQELGNRNRFGGLAEPTNCN